MERRDVKRIIALLGIYFMLQLVVRLCVSPGLELDEAEQILLTQQFSLGYGSQPPLYTWLLAGLFRIFGVGIFPLALLKNILLFSTYLLVYCAGRTLGYDRGSSVAAMLSLLFIPQIAWESQRDLTHSVLAVTITAATIVCWLKLKRNQAISSYILVGLFWGIGILGKYNFGIFLVSLLAASATIAEYRTLIARPRILYSFASMLAVISPHAIWAATHVPVLMTSSGKFKQAAQGSYAASVFKGTGSLLLASISFVGPLLVIYAVIGLRHRKRCWLTSQTKPAPNLLLRTTLFALVICMLMIILFQVTAFKDRWMQPILFFLPLALSPIVGKFIVHDRFRIVHVLASIAACAVLLGLSFRAFLAPYVGTVTRFNLPYNDLVAELGPQVKAAELVLAQSSLLGGHIRLRYPTVRVTVPGGARLYHDSAPGTALIVWQDDEQQKKPNDGFWKLVATVMGDYQPLSPPIPVRAQFRYLPGRTLSASSLLVERKPALAPRLH